MKTTLNLTTAGAALVLFATTLVMPMQANAADRQISINPRLDKLKTFTVQTDDKPVAGVEVASTSPEKPSKPGKIQEFRVNDDDTAEVETVKPQSQPKQPNTKRFKVEDESEQAAQEPVVKQPTFDDEDAEEPADVSPPAKVLTQKVKPAPVETEEGSDVTDEATEEANNEAIASDQPEATAEAATDDSAALQQEYAELLRQKHEILLKRAHKQYQDDGSYQDSYQPTYQQSYQTNYEGASCEHNNNGY